MNTQNTIEQMQILNLFGMAKHYEMVLDLAIHEQPQAHTLMANLQKLKHNTAPTNALPATLAAPSCATMRFLNRSIAALKGD